MTAPSDEPSSSVQGQLLRRSRRRQAALILHDGRLWVADFVDGQGEIVDAATWVRFNCGTATSVESARRVELESAIPLSTELQMRIEGLLAAAGRSVGGARTDDA
jgi:hypothetical protein